MNITCWSCGESVPASADFCECGASTAEEDDPRLWNTCDVCDRPKPNLTRCTVAGIETWACEECRSGPYVR